MTTETPAKPAYLGLLNAISVGEGRAGVYLKAWADVTTDPDLKPALTLIAARESTHGEVFRQRIERLGFTVRDREDPAFAEKIRLYGDPVVSDEQKIRHGRQEVQEDASTDQLADLEQRIDDNMDALTRATMAWYIAEERDTAQLLRDAYKKALARAGASG